MLGLAILFMFAVFIASYVAVSKEFQGNPEIAVITAIYAPIVIYLLARMVGG